MVLLGLPDAGPQALFAAVIGAIVVVLAVSFVYSYRVRTPDPGKRQP